MAANCDARLRRRTGVPEIGFPLLALRRLLLLLRHYHLAVLNPLVPGRIPLSCPAEYKGSDKSISLGFFFEEKKKRVRSLGGEKTSQITKNTLFHPLGEKMKHISILK